jgi:hypothetical protein
MARPGLHSLQRVSNESMSGYSNQSSTSSIPSAQSYVSGGAVTIGSGSEGGEHLAEMRERLLVVGGSGPSWSRSDSGGESSFDVNLISPTPPLRPAPSPMEYNAEAGPSRRRGSGKSSSPVLPELPAEHAWDSVVSLNSVFVAHAAVASPRSHHPRGQQRFHSRGRAIAFPDCARLAIYHPIILPSGYPNHRPSPPHLSSFELPFQAIHLSLTIQLFTPGGQLAHPRTLATARYCSQSEKIIRHRRYR